MFNQVYKEFRLLLCKLNYPVFWVVELHLTSIKGVLAK